MTRKKKSGFLTFCFSLLPGAGEMYLGFMKMGISLMGMFLGVVAVSICLNIGVVMLFDVVLWFYSFFHVHNLAGLNDEEFLNVEDDFLFHLDVLLDMGKEKEKYRNVIAVVLIAAGILILWNGLKSAFMPWIPDFIFKILSRFENTVPRILIGIGIIMGGIHMIKGKKEELNEVIIDVEPGDVQEEHGFDSKTERNGNDIMPGTMAERKAYGTETEHKNS
ncbi:MAG TPA: hypothetical protein DCZ40_07365 [Lachnospiraceae bacterium]|nr:hypothetical protein [Lachnospiraceae bacterium]